MKKLALALTAIVCLSATFCFGQQQETTYQIYEIDAGNSITVKVIRNGDANNVLASQTFNYNHVRPCELIKSFLSNVLSRKEADTSLAPVTQYCYSSAWEESIPTKQPGIPESEIYY